MAVQLLFCGVLPPGLVQYGSQHPWVIAVKLFSIRFLSVHVVPPYNSIDMTATLQKLFYFIGQVNEYIYIYIYIYIYTHILYTFYTGNRSEFLFSDESNKLETYTYI